MDNEFIVACCECKAIRDYRDNWNPVSAELSQAINESYNVSHGYCPFCAKQAFNKLREYISLEKECKKQGEQR